MANSSPPIISLRDLYAAGAYLFFGAILLQNTAALICVSLGIDAPVSVFYAVKFAVLACTIGLFALVDGIDGSLMRADRLSLFLVVVIVAVAVAKGGGLSYVANELKFYLGPIVFYLVGRITAPFKKDKQLGVFLVIVAAIYVAIGFGYILVDRQTLINGGLKSLFDEKLNEIGRGEATYNGLPINFYYFDTAGNVTNRAFGALMDPLGSAFFGATLFLHLVEAHKRRVVMGAGILAIAVAALIVLSLTRSIIVGLGVVLVSWCLAKVSRRALLLGTGIILAGIGCVMAIRSGQDMLGMLDLLDPSSLAHVNAYLQNDKLSASLVGIRFDTGTARGAESLYLTVFFECGVAGLFLYLAWFRQLYGRLQKQVKAPYVSASLQSFLVYALASLTTEHWFVFSSGALFWFLLGNTLTAIEQPQVS